PTSALDSAPDEEPTAGGSELAPVAAPMVPWQLLVGTVWLTGSALWLFLLGWRLHRFRVFLRCATPAPAAVQARIRLLGERLGLVCRPELYFTAAAVPPLLYALPGTRWLLIPSALWERLTPDQRDALLVHELAHLRRRDHWVRLVEMAATCLYWWHPLVWWAR